MILLDTNAVLWLEQGHRRSRPLRNEHHLNISPATLLELQFLIEGGRTKSFPKVTPASLASDERWFLDDVPAAHWFSAATEIGWARDPFDRLIVAHARVRGWKLATSDEGVIEHLRPGEYLAL